MKHGLDNGISPRAVVSITLGVELKKVLWWARRRKILGFCQELAQSGYPQVQSPSLAIVQPSRGHSCGVACCDLPQGEVDTPGWKIDLAEGSWGGQGALL